MEVEVFADFLVHSRGSSDVIGGGPRMVQSKHLREQSHVRSFQRFASREIQVIQAFHGEEAEGHKVAVLLIFRQLQDNFSNPFRQVNLAKLDNRIPYFQFCPRGTEFVQPANGLRAQVRAETVGIPLEDEGVVEREVQGVLELGRGEGVQALGFAHFAAGRWEWVGVGGGGGGGEWEWE